MELCVITRSDWATFERGRVPNAPAGRLPEQRAVNLGAKLAKLGALREGGGELAQSQGGQESPRAPRSRRLVHHGSSEAQTPPEARPWWRRWFG